MFYVHAQQGVALWALLKVLETGVVKFAKKLILWLLNVGLTFWIFLKNEITVFFFCFTVFFMVLED